MAQTFENQLDANFLSDEKKEYFKKSLTQMLDEVLKDNNPINRINVKNDKFPDPSDQAIVELELDYIHRMQKRNRGLIRKIQDALERLEYGTYGICEECEEEISDGRLKARPVATLCIECKRKQEEQERRIGL